MGKSDRKPRPLSKQKFAKLMADAIRAAGETAKVRYDADDFRLAIDGERTNILHLDNAYAEYCAAADDGRETILRRYVRIWFSYRKEVPDAYDDVRPDLLPGVRCRSTYEQTLLRLRTEGKREAVWPYRVLAGHLGGRPRL